MGREGKGKDLIKRSTDLLPDIAGGIAGGTIGALIPGPAGVFGEAVVGPVVTKVITEVYERYLSRREKIRVDRCVHYACLKIREHFEAGHTLRRGDFFTYDPTGRLQAEEIFESALLKCKNEPQDKCKNEPQEKKAQFLGNIFANAVFTDVAPDDVHAVLRIAERLTYRQICVLALVGKHGEYPLDEVKDAKRLEDEIVINELFELGIYKLNLLTVSDALPQGERKQALAPVGRMCFDLMSLQDASEKDLCKLADLLKAIERNPESNVSR